MRGRRSVMIRETNGGLHAVHLRQVSSIQLSLFGVEHYESDYAALEADDEHSQHGYSSEASNVRI
jgi:hypothetical protein